MQILMVFNFQNNVSGSGGDAITLYGLNDDDLLGTTWMTRRGILY